MPLAIRYLVIVVLLFFTNLASADEDRKNKPSLSLIQLESVNGWSIGIGASFSNSIYKGIDSEVSFMPVLSYRNSWFSVSITDGLGATLKQTRDWMIRANLTPRVHPIGGSNAESLSGLDREEITADLGLQFKYKLGSSANVSFAASSELTNEYRGHEIELEYAKVFPLAVVPIFLNIGLTLQDKDLANYLYGVDESEATPSRIAYSTGDVLFPHFSVSTVLPTSHQFSLFAKIKASLLPEEMTNSPIVVEDHSISGTLSIMYHFK